VAQYPFGTLPDGTHVVAFTLTNTNGLELRAITFGGIIVSLRTPDREGVLGDIVLGHDTLEPYVGQKAYLGAIVGRHANRIADARFALDGRTYVLAANDGRHHLHGGLRGFDQRVWKATPESTAAGDGVVFSRTSADGEEGYPGALHVRVRYVLTNTNELQVDYEADADGSTIVNLTQHSYFNLAAGSASDILRHELTIEADRFLPVDAGLIPTGEISDVAGTPFDLRSPRRIGDRIALADVQLQRAGGYDHTFVLKKPSTSLARAAVLADPVSGRTLEISTTEPGLQFYSGNKLDGTIVGKQGRRYGVHAGLCLETQHYPDGPNRPNFPSPVLRAGERFRSRTVLRFGTDR